MTTISNEERRWIVIGVCLTKVLTPALRDVLAREIPKWHQVLCQPPTKIDKQVFGRHQNKLAPSTWNLNYQNINNNDAIATPRAFDYAVKDPLSLAKLFVQPFMSRFTGFDKTMDISAVLSVICEAALFVGAAAHAKAVRSDVRNEWAHCNFAYWTEAKFNAAFQTMEALLKSVNLPPNDEQKLCDELNSWKTKGFELCFGQPVDNEILTLLRTEVDELRETVQTWSSEQEEIKALVFCIDEMQSHLPKEIDDLRTELKRCADQTSCYTAQMDNNSKRIKLLEKCTNELSRFYAKEEERIPYVFIAPPRNDCFTGRTKEIQDLKRILEIEETSYGKKVRVAAVCGLGGIGKTSLVSEYAHQMKDFYKGGVYWFSAEDDAHLCRTVNAVAVRIGALLNSFDLTLPNILKKISTLNDPCLIVLDCLDQHDISSNVMEFLSFPSKENIFGHFIVTTRKCKEKLVNDVPGFTEKYCLTLDRLPLEEAKQFLFARSNVVRDENVESDAECLCEELGRLPLALEQAGAYIKIVPSCNLALYLKEYKVHSLQLLRRQQARPASNDSRDRLAVHTTWLMDMEYMKNSPDGQAAVRFMNACYFFDENEIQKELLNVGLPEVEDVAYRECLSSPLGSSQVFKLLTDFSLFTYVKMDCVSTNRMVQEVVWDNLDHDPKSKAETLIDAVGMLFYAFSNCPSPRNHASLDATECEEHDISFSDPDPNSRSHFSMWSKFCMHGHHLRKKVVKESPDTVWLDSVWSLETAKIFYECAVHLSANHQQEEAKRTANFAYRILDWLPLAGYETVRKDISDGYFLFPIPLPVLFRRKIPEYCIPTFTLLESLTENFPPDASDLAPDASDLAADLSELAPNSNDLAPDATDFAIDATNPSPSPGDLAPDAADFALDDTDHTHEVGKLDLDASDDLAPDVNDPAPDVNDLAPDAADFALNYTDHTHEVSNLNLGASDDLAPDVNDLAPGATDLAIDATNPSPSPGDLAPDAADPAVGDTDHTHEVSYLDLDASHLAVGASDLVPGASDLVPGASDLVTGASDLAPDVSHLTSDATDPAPNAINLKASFQKALDAYSSAIILAQNSNQLFDPLLLTKCSKVYIKLEQWKSSLKDANDSITRHPYCWLGYALKAVALDGFNKEVSAELKDTTSAEIVAALAFYYNKDIFAHFPIFLETFPNLQSRIFICDSVDELLNAMFSREVEAGLLKILVLGSEEYILNSAIVGEPWNNCILVGTRKNRSVALKSNYNISLSKCMLTNLSFSFNKDRQLHCLPDSSVKILKCDFTSCDGCDETIKTEGKFNSEQCNFTRSSLLCAAQSDAVVRDCSFCNSSKEGIRVEEGRTFEMENSRIYHNGGAGVFISYTDCSVVNCNIHDNGRNGIRIARSKSVQLIGNNVFNSYNSGIRADRWEDSQVCVRKNHLYHNGDWGFYGTFLERCEISKNRISQNKSGGVLIDLKHNEEKNTSSVIERNEICDNGGPGLVVNGNVPGGNSYEIAKIENNEIHHNKDNDSKLNFSVPYCSYCRVKCNPTKCEECFTSVYCSKSCQEKHYLKHKEICKVLREKSSYLIMAMQKCSHDSIAGEEQVVDPKYSAPPPQDGKKFVVKVCSGQTARNYELSLYDRSYNLYEIFYSRVVFQLLREFGVLCDRQKLVKKLYFHCLFENNGHLRLFTNEFAEFQNW